MKAVSSGSIYQAASPTPVDGSVYSILNVNDDIYIGKVIIQDK